jgi:CO/xanthine dehydrogenase Mo-binding subunit
VGRDTFSTSVLSGEVTIFFGASDIGQGTNSVPAYLIAEEIGCDVRDWPLHPVIPAISNAIYDAVGVRLTSLPFHPGKLLKLMRQESAA